MIDFWRLLSLSGVGARFDSVSGDAMTVTNLAQWLVEQTTILGWRFKVYSHNADAWMPTTRLDPELSERQLRQRYGRIRNLTEIITLDDELLNMGVELDQVQTIGWQFEAYSPQTKSWHPVTKLDRELSESQLRTQLETIRHPTPIGLLSEIATEIYASNPALTESVKQAVDASTERIDSYRG